MAINDNIDFNSASGRLQLAILSAFSAFERELISERTRAFDKPLLTPTPRHCQYTKGGYAIILYLPENKHLKISFIPAFYSFNMNV